MTGPARSNKKKAQLGIFLGTGVYVYKTKWTHKVSILSVTHLPVNVFHFRQMFDAPSHLTM